FLLLLCVSSRLWCRRRASALFPYTTLFRSRLDDVLVAARLRQVRGEQTLESRLPRRLLPVLEQLDGLGLQRVQKAAGEARLEGLDRKSTRLNSSHVESSYAVFCLQKKKTTH